MVATTLIHGDPMGTGGTYSTYDFRAAAARFNGNEVYILNGTMNANKNQDWTRYRGDIDALLAITTNPTLTNAVDNEKLVEDSLGLNDPGNQWDVFVESGIDMTGDRLWSLLGSKIEVTGADDCGNDVKTFDQGYGAGEIDGTNVNSVAFIAETLRQAALGLSLKRGLGGGMAPVISASGGGEELPY
jgi:hypothetical protein